MTCESIFFIVVVCQLLLAMAFDVQRLNLERGDGDTSTTCLCFRSLVTVYCHGHRLRFVVLTLPCTWRLAPYFAKACQSDNARDHVSLPFLAVSTPGTRGRQRGSAIRCNAISTCRQQGFPLNDGSDGRPLIITLNTPHVDDLHPSGANHGHLLRTCALKCPHPSLFEFRAHCAASVNDGHAGWWLRGNFLFGKALLRETVGPRETWHRRGFHQGGRYGRWTCLRRVSWIGPSGGQTCPVSSFPLTFCYLITNTSLNSGGRSTYISCL